jgi:hypothetical protein
MRTYRCAVAKTPASAAAAMRLKEYWAHGEGAAKWITSPTPFRTLRGHLAKYVHRPDELDGLTANIYKMALGHWPGKQKANSKLTSTQRLIHQLRSSGKG